MTFSIVHIDCSTPIRSHGTAKVGPFVKDHMRGIGFHDPRCYKNAAASVSDPFRGIISTDRLIGANCYEMWAKSDDVFNHKQLLTYLRISIEATGIVSFKIRIMYYFFSDHGVLNTHLRCYKVNKQRRD
jgi:hypothetical protein